MIDVAGAIDAVGVVVAHSGTCLAILIDARREDRDECIQAASERLTALGLQPTTFATLHNRVLQETVDV
jgi:uncharacterized protein involved in propanediol utilization